MENMSIVYLIYKRADDKEGATGVYDTRIVFDSEGFKCKGIDCDATVTSHSFSNESRSSTFSSNLNSSATVEPHSTHANLNLCIQIYMSFCTNLDRS